MVRKVKDDVKGMEEHMGGGQIIVTAQQSRYALDAVDAPASKEILVKDLSIAVANRELISRTTLHLVEARHYVLVGRNGTGKSTLLKAIADGLVPGIPWSTRILLLGQTRDEDVEDIARLKLENETVLQHVVRSDRTRERYMREARTLSDAVENSIDPMAPVRAYRRIGHDRLALQLKEGHRIAERRSGARGKQARKELVKLEARFQESERQLAESEDEIDPTKLSEETQAAADMLSDVQASLELMDAGEAEAKARVVLLGLGFKDERIDNPVSELSGGWRTRCDLACALTQYADVLLLDEPTNFLDLPSIIWLQGYIGNLKGTTVLMTTHDRDFGDAVAEELIVLRNQTLETFRGNLSLYERERWKKFRYLTKMKEAQEKQKKHMEKSIAGNIKAAKDKGDDKKLKQAASRKKKLDERMGMQVSAKGGRFKLNRDLAGYHSSRRDEIEVPDWDPPVELSFPAQPPDLRFPGALVSLEKVCFAYGKSKKVPVLTDVSLTIHAGSRIGLAGLNGSGKTTLVSLIMGSNGADDLRPTSGSMVRHARVKLGRFSQQSVEEITAVASANHELTALGHVMDVAGQDVQEKDARGVLGGLGLHGATVSDVPLVLLSGGQKVRVALAKLLWPPPQLLILDEVTTHLDADTIMGLVRALKGYDGALVVVTHDRFFMRTVVEGQSPYKLAPGVRGSEDEAEADEESESEDAETGYTGITMGEAESSSTPRSTAEPQLKAAKDKNCPFCGQAFTSSSLGRHLDLYIRAKNPKAPDGVHNVDEIRKLRGGITRRQAKGSVSTPRRDDSGTSTPANKKRIASEDSSMLVQSPEEDDEPLEVGKTRGQFKDVSWGGGHRPSRLATKTPDPRRDASRQTRKADLDQRQKTSEEIEIANATEMALRELLKSVREANAKVSGTGLFDFDPYAQNFPSLCLHILPAPSTLFSPTPFATAESWSIAPPGQKQFEALNKQVRERLLAYQRQRHINHVYPSGGSNPNAPSSSSTTTSPLPTPPLFDHDPQRLFGHIADAFHHWTQHSDKTRQEYWQIEILRCYARANDSKRETEVQLEHARREIDYLKANRWTSGGPDVSPVSINLSSDTTRELAKHGMDYRNWDYDRLIDKWRTAIRENRSSVSGLAAQKPLPTDASTRSCSMTSQPTQAFAAINQPRQSSPIKVETSMPFNPPGTVSGEMGNDQVDAEGDDDDDEIDLTPQTNEEEDSMHHMQHQAHRQSLHHPQPQHNHSTPLQPTPPHHSQQFQSHMQTPQHITQAQIAQAQAQAQAWAAARQHMNQSRNQDFNPHQQHQISPHLQHVSSADSSRRESLAMMDPHNLSQSNMGGMGGSMSMSGGLDGLENHQDQFLRLDMGMATGFVGSNDGGVSMGS
ncbi:P-loop containing nucleoside triphosphate hydrolase protein [Stemphylium lycopersici]|nr:P-loop containing nucleoside triphosphate hydrolase protein [Stemphylium lycopersici]